jgi:hypothetical protein
VSHQSGLDADIGYYLVRKHSEKRFKSATAKTLDVAKTWTFFHGLLETGAVEYIFSDRKLMKPLYLYARDVAKVSQEHLIQWFPGTLTGRKGRGRIRHLKGHHNHIHIRVFSAGSKGNIAAVASRDLREKLSGLLSAAPVRVPDDHGHDHDHPDESAEASVAASDNVNPESVKPGQAVSPKPAKPRWSMTEISPAQPSGSRRRQNRQVRVAGLARLRAHQARTRARQVRRQLRARRLSRIENPADLTPQVKVPAEQTAGYPF